MSYTDTALKKKITEMYPEIGHHDVSVDLALNEEKNAYIVTFKRGGEELSTHLEKKDADECMEGVKCVYLGVQIAQFIKNFEQREIYERKVT